MPQRLEAQRVQAESHLCVEDMHKTSFFKLRSMCKEMKIMIRKSISKITAFHSSSFYNIPYQIFTSVPRNKLSKLL